MKFWLLEMKKKQRFDYDVAQGFVVLAEDEENARRCASEMAGDEGKEYWLEESSSSCEELKPESFTAGVILMDFKAG